MQQLIYDSDDFAVINAFLPPYETQESASNDKKLTTDVLVAPESNALVGFLLGNPELTKARAEAHIRPQSIERFGFEILDKRSGREVYLDGAWAEIFQEKLNLYKGRMVTQTEFERLIDDYSALATQPVYVH